MRAISVLLTTLSTFIWGPIEPQMPVHAPAVTYFPISGVALTRDGEIGCVSNSAMMYLVGHVEDTTGPCWSVSPGIDLVACVCAIPEARPFMEKYAEELNCPEGAIANSCGIAKGWDWLGRNDE